MVTCLLHTLVGQCNRACGVIDSENVGYSYGELCHRTSQRPMSTKVWWPPGLSPFCLVGMPAHPPWYKGSAYSQ